MRTFAALLSVLAAASAVSAANLRTDAAIPTEFIVPQFHGAQAALADDTSADNLYLLAAIDFPAKSGLRHFSGNFTAPPAANLAGGTWFGAQAGITALNTNKQANTLLVSVGTTGGDMYQAVAIHHYANGFNKVSKPINVTPGSPLSYEFEFQADNIWAATLTDVLTGQTTTVDGFVQAPSVVYLQTVGQNIQDCTTLPNRAAILFTQLSAFSINPISSTWNPINQTSICQSSVNTGAGDGRDVSFYINAGSN